MKKYFIYNKKEQGALYILIVVTIFIIIVHLLIDLWQSRYILNVPVVNQLASQKYDSECTNKPQAKQLYIVGHSLYYFDPNHLSDSEWKQLGVPMYVIGRINKYISKGGKFYQPKDIKKIYGFPQLLADRLIPYVKIETTQIKKMPVRIVFQYDINTAQVNDILKYIYGNSLLAYRIVHYRDLLGGFYTTSQLKEVYGMTDSLYNLICKHFKVDIKCIHPMLIHKENKDLWKHPYIRKILPFVKREMYMDTFQVKDLCAKGHVLFERIAPYVQFELSIKN